MINPFGNHNNHDSWSIAYADFITTLLGIFLICLALLLTTVKVITEFKSPVENQNIAISASIYWTVNGADVDLWGQAPGDVAVGYSNKAGKYLNLLRDDLGYDYEAINNNLHMENTIGRKLIPGWYTFNAHMFQNHNNPKNWPIHVKFELQIVSPSGATEKYFTEVDLTSDKQEITLFRFLITDSGTLDKSSMNNRFTPLASGSAGQETGGMGGFMRGFP